MSNRLKKQLQFIIEIDKIKNIIRKTRIFDNSRKENDAEHSWTITVMALLLQEYSNTNINILKVLKMLLIHDIIEIKSGDIFLYDSRRNDRYQIEKKAAEKIFGLLPKDQYSEFMDLWIEFEERTTAEAKYAHVLDRLEPLLQNFLTKGITWKEFNIKYDQVVNANKHIKDGSIELWKYALNIIDESVEKGYLSKY